MSESGPAHFPKVHPSGGETTARTSDIFPPAKLTEIPSSLERTDAPVTLRGKVIHRSDDGHIRVRTERGEIEVQSERGAQIKEGDVVDIKIAKGNPPATATLRPAPPPTQPAPPQEPPPVPLQQPITIADLPAGTHVTLAPASPQQLQQAVIPYVETTPIALAPPAPALISAPPDLFSEDLLSENLITIPSEPFAQNTALPKQEPINLFAHLATLPETDIGAVLTQAQPPPALLPLRAVIASLIAQPAESPLILTQTPNPPAEKVTPPPLTQVTIETITPAPPFIIAQETLPNTRPQDIFPPPPTHDVPNDTPNDTQRPEHITAIVTGFTPEKHFPVLHILSPENRAAQHYILPLPLTDITIGAHITLSPNLPQTPTTAPLTSPPTLPLAAPFLPFAPATTWPALDDIQAALAQIAPQAAHAMTNLIPNVANPQNLGPAILFFIAAMRTGDLQGWMGNAAVDALKRGGRIGLLDRLTQDTNTLSRDSPAQEWRTTAIPLSWNNDIHRTILHYKKDGQRHEQDNENTGGTTRFVMDLNLSRIGKVQLDGLFQGNEKTGGRLDLILRTEQSFSAAMQSDMRRLYTCALNETRFTGELMFQDQKEKWVSIAPPTDAGFLRDV